RELLCILDEEVARLPEVYRLPVLLCVLQERSVEETARLLGWSVGSARGRLARGRERLRERLERRGLCLSLGSAALLAPPVGPERLLAQSLRIPASPVSPAVTALAAGSAPALKFKVAFLVLVLAVFGLGRGLPFGPPPKPDTNPPSALAAPPPAKDAP